MSDTNTQNTAQNPLKGFFRNPGLYISLPSGGAFYEPGTVKFDRGEELAVYPMTAQDEMITRSPDALLNGDAVYKVIASCVPGILQPMDLTAKDAQALMIAIRCTTYGEDQEIDQTCAEYRYQIDSFVQCAFLAYVRPCRFVSYFLVETILQNLRAFFNAC